MSGSLLLRTCRLVPVGLPAPTFPVDVRVRHGVVTDVGHRLAAQRGEEVVDADGRWAIPGLWDAHVHLQQEARSRERLDLRGARAAEDVTAAVASAVADLLPEPADRMLWGYGYRSATWPRTPTVAELDAVSGARPVVLMSGDAHSGWLSSAALQLLGLEPRTGPLEEAGWFGVLARLDALSGGPDPDAATRAAAHDAAAKGLVGIADMEFEDGPTAWRDRAAKGFDLLRVRAAVYPDRLDAVLAARLRSGDALDGAEARVTMGPLKVIFDGSLNTRTAYCSEPYPGADGAEGWRGVLNHPPAELRALCEQATAGGLEVAVHAIGDAAVGAALDAIERAGASGSIEHVQLVARRDLRRFAALGVHASVQPAHLLDDRDVTAHVWPDREDRCFAWRSLLRAGATLRLGSDAPIAPLDPWLALAAAVHRSADERAPWNPAEALSPVEALAASTDGATTLAAGSRADLVLLDDDPLAPEPDTAAAAARLASVRVAATYLAGRPTCSAL